MEIKDVKNIDLDLNKNYYSSLMDEKAPHWNKSIQDLIVYYNKHFNKNYNYYENENGKIIDENGKLLNGADIFRLTDIKNSNAGANFSNEKEILDSVRKIVKPWAIPWYNIDGDTYRAVRESDKDLDALQRQENLQFTRSILKYKNGNDNRWMRLLMPQYSRFVEVEDLNRNFWVIGQTLSAISAFLFGPEAMIPSLLNNFLDEICQLWENLLFLQNGIEASKQIPYYNKWHFEIVEVPNEEWQAYRKYDNFDNDQLSIHLDYLEKTYTDFNLCILPKVRMNNYEHNYYGKVFYPYFLVLNRNTMQSYQEVPFDFSQNEIDLSVGFFGIKFKMNFSEIDFTKLYGIKENDDSYDYGRLDMCHTQENSNEFYGLVSNTEEIEYNSIENKVHFKSHFIDKVAGMLYNFNPQIGEFDLVFNLSTQEADGCQYTLAADIIEDTQMKTAEILNGFYQGDLISCPSNIEPEPIRFNIAASTSWTQGETYSGTITVTLTDGSTTETRTTSDISERFLFNNLLAFNGDQKITYTITETLSNSDWSIQTNSYSIQYNDAPIEEVEFVNTYTPAPIVPDWPGLILWADYRVPPQGDTWKNQIGDIDMKLRGGDIEVTNEEVIFNASTSTNDAYYNTTDSSFPQTYTIYIVAKSEQFDPILSKGDQSRWFGLNSTSGSAMSLCFQMGTEKLRPYVIPTSSSQGYNGHYNYLARGTDYHVYAFTKSGANSSIDIFMDGEKVSSCTSSAHTNYMTLFLNSGGGESRYTFKNDQKNYYKLLAFGNQAHTQANVRDYSNWIKQNLNIGTPSLDVQFLSEVGYSPQVTLDTGHTLSSDLFGFEYVFKITSTQISTYVNGRGNFIYTDDYDISRIIADADAYRSPFNFSGETVDGLEAITNEGTSSSFSANYYDRLTIKNSGTQLWVEMQDYQDPSFRNYGSENNSTLTMPKDSSIKIFGKNGCGASGRVLNMALMENERVVRSYIPARKNINDVYYYGLYDLVTENFYRSSGTAEFTG